MGTVSTSQISTSNSEKNHDMTQLIFPDTVAASSVPTPPEKAESSPILHCMLAGGFGGAVGDSVMHSLDTVKTRQQGAPNAIKYKSMINAYRTIFLEEGFARGLYGGYGAAMLGSFPSTTIFFATYESTKRLFIKDWQINDTIAHLSSGFLGDFASSFIYVPSEVLKTRLQLQGRFNNPFFYSGYNYKGLYDAIKILIRTEGPGTLFYGYKATLCRDLPFSALQFAFYEKFRLYAFFYENLDPKRDDLSLFMELFSGAAAGGLAGTLTTPLDVIKTRVQTQNPVTKPLPFSAASVLLPKANTTKSDAPKFFSTATNHQPVILHTSSILKGLSIVYKTEGILGLFSGVGPRFVWTSIQSSIMLFLYQIALRTLDDTFTENEFKS